MIQSILLRAGFYLFEFVSFLILINVLLCWVRPDPNNAIVKIIYGLTEPMLAPLRRFAIVGPVDLSPFAALLILQFLIYPLYQWIVTSIF
jgi:YggT family protein